LQRESELVEEELVFPARGLPVIAHETETQQRLVDRSADDIIAEALTAAARSPRVGLMILGSELERAVRFLLVSSGWDTSPRSYSLRRSIDRLVELGLLTRSAASALDLFQTVRNEIVHGGKVVPEEEILRALDAAIPLLRAILAIPRETNLVHYADVDLYADSRGTTKLSDAKGLLLKTLSPGGASVRYRIFPTTKTDYEIGKQVTWEWGTRTWGDTWYKDPESGEIRPAWTSSLEFRGRHLDELK
jgi:hypothetical protein